MSKKKDGGPAFPRPIGHSPDSDGRGGIYNNSYMGMTLRDYFAGQALAGWLASTEALPRVEVAATMAYRIAEAMLVVRGTEEAA